MVVESTEGLLWGMEVDVEAAKAELREIAKKDEGKGASKFLSSIGLGSLAEQLEDLKLGTAHFHLSFLATSSSVTYTFCISFFDLFFCNQARFHSQIHILLNEANYSASSTQKLMQRIRSVVHSL